GLADRRRVAAHCPHRTPAPIAAALLDARRRHPTWGPRKLLLYLARRQPRTPWPAASTVGALLRAHGLVTPRRRRRPLGHPGRPTTPMDAPNVVWTADFKGDFAVGDGSRCYPLTIADGYSRYLLACQGLAAANHVLSRPIFERLFEEHGLPARLRSDNGAPFATCALCRLSRLSVWWLRLGIQPELIEPAHPEQNGRHERMHRTLKAETTRPPAGSLAAQQRRFNNFRVEYNAERPHDGLHGATPASCYTASPRPYPERLQPIEYPGHFEVYYVSTNGGIRFRS